MTPVKLFDLIKKIVTYWWFGWLVGLVTFAINLAMPHIQFLKSIQNRIYPDSEWVGAVSFRLHDVPGYSSTSDRDLILLAHQFDENSRVTFFRDGTIPESVMAGAPAASLTIEQAKPRTSGVPLFDVDVPPATLVAASIAGSRGGPVPHYTMTTAQWTKALNEQSDLIVLTKNQLRETRTTYGLCFLALALAAVFMPRYAHLIHPEESEESPKSAPGEGDSS